MPLPTADGKRGRVMQDLISRQAAIDALDFEIVHMTAYCDGKNEGNPLAQYNKGLEDGKKAIEALPSAQPEKRWIPCSERLPEEDSRVLAFGENGIMIANYLEGWFYYIENEDGDMCPSDDIEVSYWMPLPAPPEVEDNETD